MRWNENEVASLAQQTPQWEGKLVYKAPKSKSALSGIFQTSSSSDYEESRERYFKLRANCLFYYRIPSTSKVPPLASDPMGVLILEHYHVQGEGFETANSFSLIFKDDPLKKHLFVADSPLRCKQWVTALQEASYARLRDRLVHLQIILRQKTNHDPLLGSAFESNPLFALPAQQANPSSSINALFDFEDNGKPPKAKPRRLKKSNFQSHVMENWENHSPHNSQFEEEQVKEENQRASFKSHVQVPTANLIDF